MVVAVSKLINDAVCEGLIEFRESITECEANGKGLHYRLIRSALFSTGISAAVPKAGETDRACEACFSK